MSALRLFRDDISRVNYGGCSIGEDALHASTACASGPAYACTAIIAHGPAGCMGVPLCGRLYGCTSVWQVVWVYLCAPCACRSLLFGCSVRGRCCMLGVPHALLGRRPYHSHIAYMGNWRVVVNVNVNVNNCAPSWCRKLSMQMMHAAS